MRVKLDSYIIAISYWRNQFLKSPLYVIRLQWPGSRFNFVLFERILWLQLIYSVLKLLFKHFIWNI